MLRVIQTQSRKKALVRLSLTNQQVNASSATATIGESHTAAHEPSNPRIGKREIVGFGINGRTQYFDHPPFPMPPIRWSPNTPEIGALREKAKGDWGKLTIEEKKALYRADFCQTISEVCTKGNGDWKWTLGIVLGFVGTCLWGYVWFAKTIYNYPGLSTNSIEHQTRMLERMIAQGQGKVFSYSSEWDYEKGQWKK